MQTRIRKVKTEREYEEIIDEFITTGYKIRAKGNQTTKIVKPYYGNAILHILLFIFTFFIGNIIYLTYSYFSNSEEVIIKIVKK